MEINELLKRIRALKFLSRVQSQKLNASRARDLRSRRIIVVINCILNQNARDFGAAITQGMNTEVMSILAKHGVGVLQMPCPEMTYLGLTRERPAGKTIRDVLDTPSGRECCKNLGVFVVDQIQDYIDNKFRVLAILGGNRESPGCAVRFLENNASNQRLAANSGVFMKELAAEMEKRNVRVPFRGMRDADDRMLSQDLLWLNDLLEKSERK